MPGRGVGRRRLLENDATRHSAAKASLRSSPPTPIAAEPRPGRRGGPYDFARRVLATDWGRPLPRTPRHGRARLRPIRATAAPPLPAPRRTAVRSDWRLLTAPHLLKLTDTTRHRLNPRRAVRPARLDSSTQSVRATRRRSRGRADPHRDSTPFRDTLREEQERARRDTRRLLLVRCGSPHVAAGNACLRATAGARECPVRGSAHGTSSASAWLHRPAGPSRLASPYCVASMLVSRARDARTRTYQSGPPPRHGTLELRPAERNAVPAALLEYPFREKQQRRAASRRHSAARTGPGGRRRATRGRIRDRGACPALSRWRTAPRPVRTSRPAVVSPVGRGSARWPRRRTARGTATCAPQPCTVSSAERGISRRRSAHPRSGLPDRTCCRRRASGWRCAVERAHVAVGVKAPPLGADAAGPGPDATEIAELGVGQRAGDRPGGVVVAGCRCPSTRRRGSPRGSSRSPS